MVGHLALGSPLRNFGPIFGLMVFAGGGSLGGGCSLIDHLTFGLPLRDFGPIVGRIVLEGGSLGRCGGSWLVN